MSKILAANQDYVEGHIVETLHKLDDKLDGAATLDYANQIASDLADTAIIAATAQTTANNAMPKTGGTFSGDVVTAGLRFGTGGISYELNNRAGRGVTNAGFQGTYKSSDNALVIWRNNASSAEQKIVLPLTPFGTSKMSVTNTPTPGTATGLVAMSVKTVDTGNEYNTVTNRWTATIGGYYRLDASVLKASGTETKVYFRKNGVAFGVGASLPAGAANALLNLTTEIVSLNAGDYIDVFVTAGQIVTDFPTNSLKITTVI